MRAVLDDPQATVKPAAFTWHPRPAYPPNGSDPQAMGYSMRTDRYRYTEWRNYQTGNVLARELYDHRHDAAETRNIVDAPPDQQAFQSAVKLMNEQFPRQGH